MKRKKEEIKGKGRGGRKKQRKKEEREKEKGGENSVKQGEKKLEPRWKGRKNREIREGKTRSCRNRKLIWAYFFATYLNYLKDRFLFWRGMGFHLFHSKHRGLSLSDGNIVSAYIQVCNPACLSDNSTRNGGIGYIICLVYLRSCSHNT